MILTVLLVKLLYLTNHRSVFHGMSNRSNGRPKSRRKLKGNKKRSQRKRLSHWLLNPPWTGRRQIKFFLVDIAGKKLATPKYSGICHLKRNRRLLVRSFRMLRSKIKSKMSQRKLQRKRLLSKSLKPSSSHPQDKFKENKLLHYFLTNLITRLKKLGFL